MHRYAEKIKTFIAIGKLLAPLSTCKRLKVSAIIFPVDCSAIYALGYNGPPRGLSNDSCNDVEGECGCAHAEGNAIAKFNNNVARPSILYTSFAPCHWCSSLIINCDKIVGIIYSDVYRSNRGQELMKAAHLPAIQEADIRYDHIELIRWKRLC